MSQPLPPIGVPKIPLLERQHPPLKFARPRRASVPNHADPEYAHYRSIQQVVLANAVNGLWRELSSRSAVNCLNIENETLTVHHHSQSKLSQQELAELQKATHFDKKELQQWYKGASNTSHPNPTNALSSPPLKRCRFPKGLPVRDAHQGGVPEDLQAILPVRGPVVICRLRVQCV